MFNNKRIYICSHCQLSILRSLPLVQHFRSNEGHYLFIYTKRSIFTLVVYCAFCHHPPLPLLLFSLVYSLSHSGAEGLRVCRPCSSAGRREWVTGRHLHSRARPSRCRGFLGDGVVRQKRETKSGRAQCHHHRACALHVAAAELRPGEDAHLRGAPSGPANRVPNTLHTKYSMWVL